MPYSPHVCHSMHISITSIYMPISLPVIQNTWTSWEQSTFVYNMTLMCDVYVIVFNHMTTFHTFKVIVKLQRSKTGQNDVFWALTLSCLGWMDLKIIKQFF